MTEKPYTRHIYLTRAVGERLQAFVREKYGDKRAFSIVVQQAVEEYLDRQNGKAAKRHA